MAAARRVSTLDRADGGLGAEWTVHAHRHAFPLAPSPGWRCIDSVAIFQPRTGWRAGGVPTRPGGSCCCSYLSDPCRRGGATNRASRRRERKGPRFGNLPQRTFRFTKREEKVGKVCHAASITCSRQTRSHAPHVQFLHEPRACSTVSAWDTDRTQSGSWNAA